MKIQGKPYFDLVSHYLMGTEMKESSLGKIVRESEITYLNDKGEKVTGRVAKRSINSPKGYFLDTGEFVSQQRVIAKESLGEEQQLNEDLSTFTSLGIPAAIAKSAIEEYHFPHDVKLEEVPKPTAKQFTDGDAYFIAGRTPEKSGFVIRQSYRMVSGGFYKFFKFNEEGKVISGQPESLAEARRA